MVNNRASDGPSATPWFFHDSMIQLDDARAPLATSVHLSEPQASGAGEKPPKDEVPESLHDVAEVEEKIREKEDRKKEAESVVWAKKKEPVFSTNTPYIGTINPNSTWLAFSPGDSKCLQEKFDLIQNNEDSPGDVVVGVSRLYSASLSTNTLNPIYWNTTNESNIHRSTWFYNTTLTPTEPSLENAIEEAYLQVRPWTTEYLDELQTATNVPEALEKIRIPLQYTQNVDDPEKKLTPKSVVVVFPPCCTKPEKIDVKEEKTRARSETQDLAKHAQRSRSTSPNIVIEIHPSSHPIAYVFSGSAFSPSMIPLLSTSPTPQQLLVALLSGKRPAGTLFTVQRHFDWNEWTKLKSLPDRPTDAADFKPTPVSELVLVIHGIGQKLSDRVESFNFTYAINDFGIAINDQVSSPEVAGVIQPGTSIMTLPINWRRTLNFEELKRNDKDSIVSQQENYSMQDITMKSIPAVRNMITDVMLDIPYYMSNHKPFILEAAAKEANRVYNLFIKHNPQFVSRNGHVNIIGHSLGSVIAMDLLSVQPTTVKGKDKKDVKFEFDTSNLFLVGSPVSFFLLLENSRLYPRELFNNEATQTYGFFAKKPVPPYGCMAISNIYNVLHYSDPIAYLLNPTVDPVLASSLELAALPTEKMFASNDGSGFLGNFASRIPFFTETVSRKSSRELLQQSGMKIETVEEKIVEASQSLPEVGGEVELETHDFTREFESEQKMKMLNDNGQIDWVIRLSGTLENQYLSMLTAHSGYWDNKDFARMVAIECGRQRGEKHTVEQYRAKKKK